MNNRVVVTGLGVISPVGIGKERYWQALLSGQSGIGPITLFDTEGFGAKIAGEVTDFRPEDFLERKEIKRMDRFAQFAVATAKLAVQDAGLDLDRVDLDRLAVVFGSGIGGMATFEDQKRVLIERGPSRISPFFVPMMIGNMAAGQISIALGARGPNYTLVNACATGTNAVGDAFKLLQRGDADIVISGGSEASITPLAVGGFVSMKALSTRNDEPTRASRPFDRQRDGFVLGEGAGVLILETLDHARQRGAQIYAEVIGYGATADAYHITIPAPGGSGAAKAMQNAMKDARIVPEAISYINAHGTSTDLNDKLETLALKTVLGDYAYRVAVSSTKSMTGHLLGAAGAIELVACALAIWEDSIPPTINYEEPDPECDLDYVPNEARQCRVDVAMSNSFGFGGHNAAVILRKI